MYTHTQTLSLKTDDRFVCMDLVQTVQIFNHMLLSIFWLCCHLSPHFHLTPPPPLSFTFSPPVSFYPCFSLSFFQPQHQNNIVARPLASPRKLNRQRSAKRTVSYDTHTTHTHALPALRFTLAPFTWRDVTQTHTDPPPPPPHTHTHTQNKEDVEVEHSMTIATHRS